LSSRYLVARAKQIVVIVSVIVLKSEIETIEEMEDTYTLLRFETVELDASRHFMKLLYSYVHQSKLR